MRREENKDVASTQKKQDKDLTFKEVLELKKKEQKRFYERKSEVDEIRKQLNSINSEVQIISKNINPKYKSEEKV